MIVIMDFDQVLKKRRMVRSFKVKEIEDVMINNLLKNAHRAQVQGFYSNKNS